MISLHSVTLEWRKRNVLRVRHCAFNKRGRHLVAAMYIFDIFIKTGSTKSSIEFFDNLGSREEVCSTSPGYVPCDFGCRTVAVVVFIGIFSK